MTKNYFVLDHPVWNALTSAHQTMARANGLAIRYPNAVSPLAALREPTPQAFADLHALVGSGEIVGLVTAEPLEVPDDWKVLLARPIDQMICTATPIFSPIRLMRLTDEDVPEMLALTAVTEPGPFLAGTIQMGHYFGVRSNTGRLVAMAGQRMELGEFIEISAVCTHPEFRGNGYAQSLVGSLCAQILSEGKTPILHVKTENAAKTLYEKIGFNVRRAVQFTVLTPQ
ncbi:GNAT family N-acetyltransferase [Glaciimonas soli]|uniref:GNAT family N-acetyltransferase n=1 Tax=Glaciimonas soli TaxID=2590999 RepID=A0A843YVA6_9BURK|nr:GNAT family N-acetyltransferase [Glaciimonas soli]MQR01428.1 GNAT family N-acetyltransferase [Glaciimonas soli]